MMSSNSGNCRWEMVGIGNAPKPIWAETVADSRAQESNTVSEASAGEEEERSSRGQYRGLQEFGREI